MSRNFSRKANQNFRANLRNARPNQPRTREEVVRMLREIGFILKMTQQIRDEIESEYKIRQPVTI
jgi:hypothetical protein